MYLAVAIYEEEGFIGSRETSLASSDSLANFLSMEFNGIPDQILLIENGETSPNLIRHYYRGHDYDVR